MHAAIALFQQKDYRTTSLEDIIVGVGGSIGCFYHRFQSKDVLLFLILDEFISSALECRRAIRDRDDTAALRLTDALIVG